MAILNEKNNQTEKVIHLMITDRCDRNCKYCCNKQYDVNEIPIVTIEELARAESIYLTGGEPFAYANPCNTAKIIKKLYSNIDRVIVYTNAYELGEYLRRGNRIDGIDGLTISIKDSRDNAAFTEFIAYNEAINNLKYLRLYVFKGFEDIEVPYWYDVRTREWQKEFKAAPDSIFRRIAFLPKHK